MKNAPRGAATKIATTATVKTIFPQGSPMARGMPPIAACTVSLWGIGKHAENPFLPGKGSFKKAEADAKHTEKKYAKNQKYTEQSCQRLHTEYQQLPRLTQRAGFLLQPTAY